MSDKVTLEYSLPYPLVLHGYYRMGMVTLLDLILPFSQSSRHLDLGLFGLCRTRVSRFPDGIGADPVQKAHQKSLKCRD